MEEASSASTPKQTEDFTVKQTLLPQRREVQCPKRSTCDPMAVASSQALHLECPSVVASYHRTIGPSAPSAPLPLGVVGPFAQAPHLQPNDHHTLLSSPPQAPLCRRTLSGPPPQAPHLRPPLPSGRRTPSATSPASDKASSSACHKVFYCF